MTGEKEVKNYSAILFCGSDILSYTQILKMIHDELDNVLPPVDLHQATDCSNTPSILLFNARNRDVVDMHSMDTRNNWIRYHVQEFGLV